MTQLSTGWSAGSAGVWEYMVRGDDQIFYSKEEAIRRQRDLGYDYNARVDLRENAWHAVIYVRPFGTEEWGWSSGYPHTTPEVAL